MIVHTLPLGSLEANCYILCAEGSSDCLVLDPGGEPSKLFSFLEQRALVVRAVLLTHRHFDHVGAADAVAKKFGCPIYLHTLDREMSFPVLFGSVGATVSYDEGDILELAGLTLTVLHTPGHTPGGVCLLCENSLFTGDTLFAGSCGRTDFPGSSPKDMLHSLARLRELVGDPTVYPGHGAPTTLEEERQHNPYMP